MRLSSSSFKFFQVLSGSHPNNTSAIVFIKMDWYANFWPEIRPVELSIIEFNDMVMVINHREREWVLSRQGSSISSLLFSSKFWVEIHVSPIMFIIRESRIERY